MTDVSQGKAERVSQRRKRKRDKSEPEELSAKKPVSRFRQVVPSTRRKPRDPRFDEASGSLDVGRFRQAYAFVDQYKADELRKVSKQLKKVRSQKKKSALQAVLAKHKQQTREREAKDRQREALSSWKKEERRRVAQGKKPFYLKKTDLKTLELANKFLSLKKEGRLDKAIVKRRRKNASKDHRWMPTRFAPGMTSRPSSGRRPRGGAKRVRPGSGSKRSGGRPAPE